MDVNSSLRAYFFSQSRGRFLYRRKQYLLNHFDIEVRRIPVLLLSMVWAQSNYFKRYQHFFFVTITVLLTEHVKIINMLINN